MVIDSPLGGSRPKKILLLFNGIIFNVCRSLISKEYNRQDITRVDNIIDVDQKEKWSKNNNWYVKSGPWGTPIFKFNDVD